METINKLSLKIKPNYEVYINPNRWLSYDYIHFVVAIGGRGIGKTTGCLISSILDYINNGNQFIYVRRYKSELKKAKAVLDPIIAGVKTQGIGSGAFEYVIGKHRIGYGLALALQQSFKSGIDFSKVHYLIFDEAILKRGGMYRYLDDEVEQLLELISTVYRTRTDYKIFILGNNADLFNPYFEYFSVPKLEASGKNIYIDKGRGLLCELCKHNPKLLVEEEKTPLFQLTKGTAYGDYHYANEVLTDEKVEVSSKVATGQPDFRVIYNNITLNVYREGISELYVELKDKPINDSLAYVLMEKNKPNYYNMKLFRNSSAIKLLEICYYNHSVKYNEQRAGAVLAEVMEVI